MTRRPRVINFVAGFNRTLPWKSRLRTANNYCEIDAKSGVILNRRSDVGEAEIAKDGEGSQASQGVLNPTGFQRQLRILRSFAVPRCSGFALRRSGGSG